MVPSVGRIVHYRLSERDAGVINKRRQDAHRHAGEHLEHPSGVVVHTGNPAGPGDVYPLLITRVWDGENATEASCVQGQVFLDGNDTVWVTSCVQQGHTYDPEITEGVWFEPPRVG